MGDLEGLLSLLQNTDRAFATFDGEYLLDEQPVVAEKARAAAAERRPKSSRFAGGKSGSSSGTFSVRLGASDAGDDGETPEPCTVRLSAQSPGRFRERIGDGADAIVVVRDGDRWWSYDTFMGVMSNANSNNPRRSGVTGNFERLVNPGGLLGALRFEAGDRAERLGRSVIHARAVPGNDTHRPLFGFGSGADRFDFEVDAERGVILRMQASFNDEELLTLEAQRIKFDEPLPPDTFRFIAPAGPAPAKGVLPMLLRRLLQPH